jgi:sensor histidine kinase regulating citrate/malate metabolism
METTQKPRGSFPLQWKVSLLVGTMLALLAIATGVSNIVYFRNVLHKEARDRGKAISATLASALVEMPDSAVGSTIASVKKEANLAYVEVVGPNGAIIAHTFEGRAPAQEPAVLKEAARISENIIDGVTYIDVPAAVITGAIVHVGLDPAEGNNRVLEAQKLLLGITLLALLVALGIAVPQLRRAAAAAHPRRLDDRRGRSHPEGRGDHQ